MPDPVDLIRCFLYDDPGGVQFLADIGLALDENHAQSGARSLDRARHAGETCTDDQQIRTDAGCHVRCRRLISSRDAE